MVPEFLLGIEYWAPIENIPIKVTIFVSPEMRMREGSAEFQLNFTGSRSGLNETPGSPPPRADKNTAISVKKLPSIYISLEWEHSYTVCLLRPLNHATLLIGYARSPPTSKAEDSARHEGRPRARKPHRRKPQRRRSRSARYRVQVSSERSWTRNPPISPCCLLTSAMHAVCRRSRQPGQALHCDADPLVGRGQPDPDVARTGGTVEVAGGDEHADLGQPSHGVPARLVRSAP